MGGGAHSSFVAYGFQTHLATAHGARGTSFKPSPQQKVQMQKLRLGELIAFIQGPRLIM